MSPTRSSRMRTETRPMPKRVKLSGNIMYFNIYAKLPSLNEYQDACRANKYKGAKMKSETDTIIGWFIRKAVREGTLQAVNGPVRLNFIWYEKTKRRDPDNVASAKKFILDALQKQGILPNDSRKYIYGFSDEIRDGVTDIVKVEIQEV